MAFTLNTFDKLTISNLIGAPTAYTFGSVTDTLATISASAYFNEVNNRLSIGDIILIQSTDTVTFLKVTQLLPDVETAELDDGGANDVTSVNGKNGAVILSPQDLQVIQTGTVGTLITDTTTYFGVTGGTAKTLTVPTTMIAKDGFQLLIKDEAGNAFAANILVNAEGGELLDGQASIPITVDFGVLRLYMRNGALFSW